MLMTYVACDTLLETGGRLGFIITQSLFKTSGAGQGFRRFEIPRGKAKPLPLRVIHVDDMVELNPFEGASNRTAVMVLEKGSRTRFTSCGTPSRRSPSSRPTGSSERCRSSTSPGVSSCVSSAGDPPPTISSLDPAAGLVRSGWPQTSHLAHAPTARS